MRRHSAGPIRQLSLQAEPLKSERCRALVKQQSVDSSRLNVTAGPVRRPSPRPGPKVAWADRAVESSVISQQRPLVVRGSARASSASSAPRSLPNPNTELFARLRKSWREHEHSRRNLNIFLAHVKVSGDDPDLFNTRSDDEDEDRTRVILSDCSNVEDSSSKKDEIVICSSVDKACPSPVPTKNPEPSPPYSVAFALSIQDETETDAQSCSEKKIAIEIDVPRNLQSLTEDSKDELPPQSLDILPNKFPATALSATTRRLNFKNSKNVQSTPVVEIQPAPMKPAGNPPLLVRSSSLQVPSPCPTPTKGILKDRKLLQPSVSFEEVDKLQTLQLPRAKSAPVRKKVKVPQKKGKRCDSPDEDDLKEEEKRTVNSKNGRRPQRVPSDVVTMVSLLSPTTSSDEATELDNPPSEAGAAVEPSDTSSTTTDSQPVATSPQAWDGTPSEFRTFYLRKPAKCVSFQGNILPSSTSPLNATETAVVAAVSLAASTAASTAASPLLGYSFSEKRAPSFIPPNAEPQTAKRRFIRTPDLTLDMHCPREESPDRGDETTDTPPPFFTRVRSVDHKEEEQLDDQPEFRSPKERECWALFRRMTEKGLPVSYDTVLRNPPNRIN